MKFFCLLALLQVASGFMVGGARPMVQSVVSAKMILPDTATTLAIADKIGLSPTTLLAAETIRKSIKSEGDELLEDIFSTLPTVGTVLAVAWVIYEIVKGRLEA
mmetsp:Transcript_11450/g.28573  ORF Transcript_11450/g.28573 Transcript_11450/m.28573 type:complete len:104 (-) Transcript_11450:135-446(-)|eukprot:3942380-Prymnesium_polylepis.1